MTTAPEPVTYGNWRKARGLGIGHLSPAQSLVLVGCVGVPTLASSLLGLIETLPLIGVAVVVALLLVVRVRGTTPAEVIVRAARFSMARKRGWADLSGGMLTDHPRGHDLPGVMAPLAPLSTDDGRGGKQGLLWHRRSGHITAVLRVSPLGVELADSSDVDAWVANWGAFLADLGYRPMIDHVAITTDTVPAGGSSSRDYIAERIDPTSPPAAQAVMRELAELTPDAVADVDTRISITFDPAVAPIKPDDLLAAAAEVTRWLPGVEQMLAPCGIAYNNRLTAEEITAILRTAYDPAARADAARSLTSPNRHELLRWEEAGPVRATEEWDLWRHDSAISVTWALTEAPRQAVISQVLLPLLSPGPYARRVTLLYRPFPAEDAARKLESEISNTVIRQWWNRTTQRDTTQRDIDDNAQARQAAREESAGAGVGTFTLYVSTSVPHADFLPAAIADVEQRAGQAKLRLRRLNGAHAAGFAAALGMGIDPATTTGKARR
ncbi:hypothetical protein BAY61_32205 (plasmid) [Prauserella marina]|uniref:Uncharacterized protein n=1 Tax=Prauserella marina TaxID=530584 RepID=A0A222W181_9PSEU|nr:SCO6880 family protein [Prauserella marina]ASR39947.1 hypothetical protein BAY61_32205 [Prauserella marina]PWV71450.1 hypothetical protein DES30_112166 [Prauserella marina]SDD97405.1 hypothetical protein SAMN05421630_115113 [Prauserella marina]